MLEFLKEWLASALRTVIVWALLVEEIRRRIDQIARSVEILDRDIEIALAHTAPAYGVN